MPNKKFLIFSNDVKSIVNFRLDFLLELKALGYEINVVCPDINLSDYSSELLDYNFNLYDLPLNRVGMNILSEFKTLYYLYRVINLVKPDYFLGYTIKPCIYGSIIAKMVGIKNINMLITGLGYVFSDYSEHKGKNKIILSLYKIACSCANNIIFQNNDDALLFKEIGLIRNLEKVNVVNGSGVNLKLFPIAPLIYNKGYTPNFLMVSRLLKDKGIYEYIEAIRKVKKFFPYITFGILGSVDSNPLSVDLAELKKWIEEGLITYHGYNNEVKNVIKEYNIIVLPSYREGVPRAILEGMAMGRAIITTNAPGCRETVIDGVNGYLVDARSSESLYLAFIRIIENPILIQKMSIESISLIRKKFDVNLINKEMIKIMNL